MKVTAMLFDLTQGNLDTHEASKITMTSGSNIINDIIQLNNNEFIHSPFAQLIEIECELDSYDHVTNKTMSNILGIDENNLLFYNFYKHVFTKNRLFTSEFRPSMWITKLFFLANKEMFKKADPIFDIRFKNDDGKWSSWQAIAGKFIVAQENKFGPGGIASVYSPITEKEIEGFKSKFQIRYSGSIIYELVMPNTLPRIIKDPINSDIRKIIDPNTYQILFDSQIIQEVSSEKSYEVWRGFEERYS